MTTLLLPLDGSGLSRHAFRAIGRLFDPATCTVRVLHVADVPIGVHERVERPMASEAWRGGIAAAVAEPHPIYAQQVWDSTKASIVEAMRSEVRTLAEAGYTLRIDVRFGDPAQEIADLVEEGAVDAVVMATHGRSGVARAALGSVAERVLRMVQVPVIMIRGRDDGRAPLTSLA